MGNKTVVLYQRVKLNGKWTFQKVTGPRLRNLCDGTYYLSWYEGSKKQMENVGPDAAQALKALDKRPAHQPKTASQFPVEGKALRPGEERSQGSYPKRVHGKDEAVLRG